MRNVVKCAACTRAAIQSKTALLTCLLWLACTLPSETPEEVSRSRTQIDYVLELTQGGGVAGLYKTYRLHADGLLEAHQRIGFNDSLLWKARLGVQQVEELRDALLGEDVLRQRAHGRGNRTAFVQYTAGSDTVRWSWDMSGEAPQALGGWFRQTWQLCALQAPQ